MSSFGTWLRWGSERTVAVLTSIAIAVAVAACGDDDVAPTDGGANVDGGTDGGTRPADGGPTAPACAPGAPYDPYTIVPTSELAVVRGRRPARVSLHVHTPYSHDACDERGFVNERGEQDYETGTRNEACFMQLRRGICESGQDLVFLTDHNDFFRFFEYEGLLLYTEGDELVMEDGAPVANRIRCDDGRFVTVQTGIDYDLLSIGMKRHAGATPDERATVYGQDTEEAIAALRATDAVIIAGYVPRWDETLVHTLSFDAYEIYNPVFNFRAKIDVILPYVLDLNNPRRAPGLPVPEITMLMVFEEDQDALGRWATDVQSRRMPGVLGVNAHQNVLANPGPDGERLDSFRRLLRWFSNHLLIDAGAEITVEGAKQAIVAGRAYGVYDYLGVPDGFDFRAESNGTTYEMGDEVPAGAPVDLHVAMPTVHGLGDVPPELAPAIRIRLVKAGAAAWEEVMSSTDDLTLTDVEPGVYRADVLITPNHLRPCMGSDPDGLMREVVWIYGNPIFVGMDYGG